MFRYWFCIVAIFSLSSCQSAHRATQNATAPKSQEPGTRIIELLDMPLIGPKLRLGGFSGLGFEGVDSSTGEWRFITHTDRGPNLMPIKLPGGIVQRAFIDPAFQPEVVRLRYSPEKNTVTVAERIKLTSSSGGRISGLPNLSNGIDEVPVESSGKPLKPDPGGLDPEAIVRDADGSLWMGEEYRPSIVHFSAAGRLISRWVAKGSKPEFGEPKLPEHYLKRRLNRGFEGLALAGGSLFSFLQSSLTSDRDVARVLEISKSGEPRAEFGYPFEPTPDGAESIERIGDAVAIGPGRFLVIEQNESTGTDAFRRVYEFDVRGATDLLRFDGGKKLTRKDICSTGGKQKCFIPGKKTLVADLVEAGLRKYEKAEGLAVVDDRTIAVMTDNDFGVSSSMPPSALAIIRLAKPLRLGD